VRNIKDANGFELGMLETTTLPVIDVAKRKKATPWKASSA
jgi:hypothetical protein